MCGILICFIEYSFKEVTKYDSSPTDYINLTQKTLYPSEMAAENLWSFLTGKVYIIPNRIKPMVLIAKFAHMCTTHEV